MLNATTTLAAVFRRCNAVLSGGLEGVDALGEKVRISAHQDCCCVAALETSSMAMRTVRAYVACTVVCVAVIGTSRWPCMRTLRFAIGQAVLFISSGLYQKGVHGTKRSYSR